MTRARTIGLIAWAAAALMALVGAGTASAKSTELFSGATTLSPGTTIGLSLAGGTSLVLESTSGGLINTCPTSTIDANTSQTTVTGGPVTAEIAEFTWGGLAHPCAFTHDTLFVGTLSITNIGNTEGTVTLSNTVFTMGISGTTCIYGTGVSTHLGATSGTGLRVNTVINEQEPKKLLCHDTIRWIAEYVITSPKELRVEE
jgi:hypothetical protein